MALRSALMLRLQLALSRAPWSAVAWEPELALSWVPELVLASAWGWERLWAAAWVLAPVEVWVPQLAAMSVLELALL